MLSILYCQLLYDLSNLQSNRGNGSIELALPACKNSGPGLIPAKQDTFFQPVLGGLSLINMDTVRDRN